MQAKTLGLRHQGNVVWRKGTNKQVSRWIEDDGLAAGMIVITFRSKETTDTTGEEQVIRIRKLNNLAPSDAAQSLDSGARHSVPQVGFASWTGSEQRRQVAL
jgi:hypothetical protein